MFSLILALVVLFLGFHFYGRLTEKVFAPDDRQTPAIAINDGVDCVPMKPWKAFLVQLLNIAGTGPIFGALMGACFGPVVFLWIVLGAILGGAAMKPSFSRGFFASSRTISFTVSFTFG